MIEKKEFIAKTLNLKDEIFVLYLASINTDLDVYSFYREKIAFLKTDKAFTFDLPKYNNFTDIFSKNLVAKLLNHTGINNYIIDLIEGY